MLNPLACKKLFVLAVLFVCSWVANAQELPDTLSLKYTAFKGKLYLGTISKTLFRKGRLYVSTTTVNPISSLSLIADKISEESRFEIQNGRLFPRKFTLTRSGRKSYHRVVDFDWQKNVLNYSGHRQEPIPQGTTLDAGSLIFSYMLNPRSKKPGSMVYVVNGKEIETHRLSNVREEMLDTAIGNFRALRIEHTRTDKPQRSLTIWLAIEKYYLPLKMVKTRKGGTTALRIAKVEGI